MPFAVPRLETIQYDGANGQHIADEFLSNTKLVSDDGQLLRLSDGTNDPEIPLGYWVIRQAISVGLFQYIGVYSDADFQARYAPLP